MVVALAMGFNYTNGFHDAANAIATSVSTRALTPRVALGMAAVANLVGAFFGTKVAQTIGSGIIEQPSGINGLWLVAAALVGAIGWNLLTWWLGLPSSSSHALIGGLGGAALAAGVAVQWDAILTKVVIPMIASPLVGLAIGYLVMTAILWTFRRPNPAGSRGLPAGADGVRCAMAFGHGLQDAAKTAGVVVLALNISGYHERRHHPHLGAGPVCDRHRARHLCGWLADHAHARPPDHPPRPAAGLRGRDDGGLDPLRGGHGLRRADLDDAHHHLRDHGRRLHEAILRGALGRRRQHRRRVVPDLPRAPVSSPPDVVPHRCRCVEVHPRGEPGLGALGARGCEVRGVPVSRSGR